ncbi:MAG: Gx transporter family protein [Lachnospiraceae bacterium]|nr:Gx transporter family protein [Lachnospiraceae bacterium]
MKTKKITIFGVLIALAFILSYIESLIPIPIPVPGIKLGLANLVVITGLYVMGEKEAFVLSLIRILLVSFTFGSPSTLLFSFAGGILSCFCMILMKQIGKFSLTGVSIAGGVAHNIGQVFIAILVVNNILMIYYLPFLLISGLVTGLVIGMVGALIVGSVKKYHLVTGNNN